MIHVGADHLIRLESITKVYGSGDAAVVALNDFSLNVAAGESYLPEELEGERFYEPTDRGYERMIGERLRRIRGEDDGDPKAS